MSDVGRVIVNTGNGKGKTTAALGTAVRALGHGHKVCIVQFLKGQGKYGERLMAEKFDNLDWFICGRGFVFKKDNIMMTVRWPGKVFSWQRRKLREMSTI